MTYEFTIRVTATRHDAETLRAGLIEDLKDHGWTNATVTDLSESGRSWHTSSISLSLSNDPSVCSDRHESSAA